MQTNPGHFPDETSGKRVRVRLRNGYDTAAREPAGWAADGKGGCNWKLQGHPFDIVSYQVI
jgi:hypothetical protein